MIGYVMVGTNDLGRAAEFYDAVRAPDAIEFYVTTPFDKRPATPGNGSMIALAAPDLKGLGRFHSVGMKNGGTDACGIT